jgi:RimJ/RimL family protein N-acetyltransferase
MSIELTFRRMREDDKEPLLLILEKLWGRNEFISTYFDEWIHDETGEFTAVEHDGKLIACAKLTFITENDAWLQALRKDPTVELKGVGKAISDHYVELLKKRPGVKTIRFSTYIKNHKSIALNQHAGFRIKKTFSIKTHHFMPTSIEKKPELEKVAVIRDSAMILDFIKKSEYFTYTENLLHKDWVVYPYSDNLIINDFVNTDSCFGIMEDDILKALTMVYIYRNNLTLTFFDALDFKSAQILMSFLRFHASDNASYRITAYLPDYPRIKQLFTRLYFRSWEQENDFLVFEYPLVEQH